MSETTDDRPAGDEDPGGRDAVQQLFHDLPKPYEYYHDCHDEAMFSKYNKALGKFLANPRLKDCEDPDLQFLVKRAEYVQVTKIMVSFAASLGWLALTKDPATLTGDSLKNQHLRLYRWIAQGMKDETSPFRDPSSSPGQTTGTVSHACLPDTSSFSSNGNCAYCGHANAQLTCNDCAVLVTYRLVHRTAYCSHSCLARDKKHHAASCRDWRMMANGASLFQELFVTIIEAVQFYSVESITEQHGLITVRYHDYIERIFLAGHAFTPFRRDSAVSDEISTAVLLNGHCGHVPKFFLPLLDTLLYPACKSLHEVTFFPKNIERAVFWGPSPTNGPDEINSFRTHTVVCAVLNCGRKVALDPTGAQFGWNEYVTPWEEFAAHRIRFQTSSRTLARGARHTLDERLESDRTAEKVGLLQATEIACDVYSNQFIQQIARLLLENGVENDIEGIDKLLDLPQHRFELARDHIAGKCKKYMAEEVAGRRGRWSPRFRMYFGRALDIRVINRPWEAVVLSQVWLTRRQWKENKDDEQSLKVLWRKRLRIARGRDRRGLGPVPRQP